MTRLVKGVGINDRKYTTTVDGKIRKEYELWTGMLNRCYSENYHKKNPTYLGCTVSDNFKHYTYFFEWCQLQIGFGICDYNLDKDLLYKGNKEYNENSCIFLPTLLNNLFVKRQLDRGTFPIGVSKDGKNYRAQCSYNGIRKNIGTFTTPELAFNAYKAFKEAHIKELAEKYKDTIDSRAYLALMNYEVSIDD